MIPIIRILIAITIIFSLPLHAAKFSLRSEFLKFRYIQIEGSTEADCTHTTSNDIDWDVECPVESKLLKYSVHLVLSHYPITNEGYPAYELLYWISDISTSLTVGNSVSQWIYLDSAQTKLKKLQTRLGIENDHSYLQLKLDLR